jgi:hypothetical protein
MKSRKEQLRKLEEAFKAVYRNEAKIHVSPAWENNVMRAIRMIGLQPVRNSFDFEWVGHLVWRFTAVTCLFALALTLYVMLSDLGTASEVTRLFFDDPLGVDMVHSFGII